MKEYERLTREYQFDCSRCEDRKCTKDGFCYDETFCKIYNRLAELEDDLESGKMIRLPCKVGDIVYYVNKYKKTIEECEVLGFTLTSNYTVLVRIGIQVFLYENEIILTKAEAEAKLKELKE